MTPNTSQQDGTPIKVHNFTQTCTKPYDRHTYTIRQPDGMSITFDDYMQVQAFWFQKNSLFPPGTVVIINDVQTIPDNSNQTKTKTSPQGFN
jgi:hypothetical protein